MGEIKKFLKDWSDKIQQADEKEKTEPKQRGDEHVHRAKSICFITDKYQRVLLQLRRNVTNQGKWGYIESDIFSTESPKESCIRYIKNTLGVDVSNDIQYFDDINWDNPNYSVSGTNHMFIVNGFIDKYGDNNHPDFKWFSTKEIIKYEKSIGQVEGVLGMDVSQLWLLYNCFPENTAKC